MTASVRPRPPRSALLRLKKGADGPSTLAFHRADGTVTVQKLNGAFPLHDLTHYVVETTLGIEEGFLGLVAQGWEVGDFGSPWPRGPLPAEAIWTEFVVGAIWTARVNARELPLEELNAGLDMARVSEPSLLARRLTAAELDRIHRRSDELLERWLVVEPGEALELPFPASPET